MKFPGDTVMRGVHEAFALEEASSILGEQVYRPKASRPCLRHEVFRDSRTQCLSAGTESHGERPQQSEAAINFQCSSTDHLAIFDIGNEKIALHIKIVCRETGRLEQGHESLEVVPGRYRIDCVVHRPNVRMSLSGASPVNK